MVAADSSELIRYYRNQGFIWVALTPSYLEHRRHLTYYIDEGKRLKIRNIRIIGVSASDEKAVLSKIPLKKKTPFTLFGQQETERLAKKYYKDRGYPYVVVNVDTAISQADVELTLSVVPGKRTWISSISFSGAPPSFVHPDFLMRSTRLKAGELYSGQRLDRANRLIYATSLFSRVRMQLLKVPSGREDSLDVEFELTPTKTHAILLGVGLQTAPDTLIPDRILLSAGWENLNLFHRGVTFSSEVTFVPTFGGDYEIALELRNRYPNFLPWGLALLVSPYFQHRLNRDTVNIFTYTLGGEAGLEKDFSDKLRVGISAQVKQVWQTPRGLPLDVTGATNFLRLSLIYDNRNDFFNPSSGVFFYPYADWAGKPFGGDNDFVRLNAEFRNYLALPLDAVLAWRLRSGMIIPHSGMTYEEIFLSEEFSLGGSGTVRAIWDRYLGPDTIVYTRPEVKNGDTTFQRRVERYGTFVFLHNLEIRTPYFIKNLIGFVVFIDIGLCTRDYNSTPEPDKEWAWGPGAGIRINTPIGPVRIDYAKNALKPYYLDLEHRTEKNDIGRIELGFLQAF
jgi:outer membrane protein assembly factor BamA